MGLICLVGQLYFFALFARIILSWFPLQPDGAGAQAFSLLYTVTEPVLGPVRRAIPPVRIGGMGLDISVIIVVFGLQILLRAIGC
jgi:YggT family protein